MSAIHRTARAIVNGLFLCVAMAASGLAAAVSWTYLDGPYGGPRRHDSGFRKSSNTDMLMACSLNLCRI